MKKQKKYIALILLEIFIFPIVFHFAHIAHHHTGGNNDHQCVHAVEKLSVKTTHTFTPHKHQNHCSICEYKFPVNSHPHHQNYKAIKTIKQTCFAESIFANPSKTLSENIPQRAPPSIS